MWSWISFITFGFLIMLLGTAIWTSASPAKVLTSWFTRATPERGLDELTKKDLRKIVLEQEQTIKALREQLSRYEENEATNVGIIRTESAALNMRTGPTISSDIVLRIPDGTRVNVLYYDDTELFLEGKKGSWCRIRYEDQEGWVWGNYLDTTKMD